MNYMDLLLGYGTDEDEILHQFFLHPLSKEERMQYSEKDTDRAARRLIDILRRVPTGTIIDILSRHSDEIPVITTGSIPQFSNIDDLDRVPGIVMSNPGCKYKLIGYFFNKDAQESAQQKYGENHYKAAAQIGLCEEVIKKTEASMPEVTKLGEVYDELDKEDKETVKAKLCFLIPVIQKFFTEGRNGTVDAKGLYESMLSAATVIRRRSSTMMLIRCIAKTLEGPDKDIPSRIFWGYHNAKQI